jgi:acetyl esterase/lipase
MALLLNLREEGTQDYLAGQPLDDPLLNPLKQNLTGLPPMLIQGATGDPTREDAHQLAERARAHGVETRLELYPVDTHSFQIFWSFLPDAREAIEQAGRFIHPIADGRGYAAAGVG